MQFIQIKNRIVFKIKAGYNYNNYQQASKVLFTFVPNKQFRQLITISPHLLAMLKTTQSIQVMFTDQNNRPLEIEDNVNITVIIE